MTTIPEHLGGFGTGPNGDESTFFPDLWTWLVNGRGIRSVLDIGCGEGHALRCFRDLEVRVLGIEGVPQDDDDIVQHDFTEEPWVDHDGFGLGWCCEFLEHVEEQYLPNVAPAIQACDLVLMTHAFPGQGGHHHVNCREPAYWSNWFGLLGYRLDEMLTAQCRALAQLNPSPWNHFVRSGMAFVRH